MSSINYPKTKDTTTAAFTALSDSEVEINGPEYEMVYAYLRGVFNTDQAAGDFTATILQIANDSDREVESILAELQALDQITLTATLAFYLNRLRDPSTLLGVAAIVAPNWYTARNIMP